MARSASPDVDLVVTSNFIHAARDGGYSSLTHALAELIDNSLQASATIIEITLKRPSAAAKPSISVRDNGRGMNRAELTACLKFGGTSRFNDRGSLGRYGMGLPAASLSQARTVTVHAWQGRGVVMSVGLDVDHVANGDLSGLKPRRAPGFGTGDWPSGCRVTWTDCDRVEYQRLGWLERSLARDLGRMFRIFLGRGVQLLINGRPILAHDPLFRDGDYAGTRATVPFNSLTYELSTPTGCTSEIEVRFSELPVREWYALDGVTKKRMGVVGGAGTSILRADREIAYGCRPPTRWDHLSASGMGPGPGPSASAG